MFLTGFLTLLLLAVVACEQARNFNEFKLLEITPETTEHIAALNDLRHGKVAPVDFWRTASDLHPSALVMVHQEHVTKLTEHLNAHGMTAKAVVDNIQKMIDENTAPDAKSRTPFTYGQSSKEFNVSQYHSFYEINAYFHTLATENPSKISVISIGKSTQGRETFVLKIGKAGSKKKNFMLEAGLHAREWIAPSTALYIANELATNDQYDSLISAVDFYILPSANPDGYEYSRTSDLARLWRKNRRHFGNCIGVDLNRNFDFMWDPAIASSDNPCDDNYRGPGALSELETQNVAKFVRGFGKGFFNAYITLHAFSQYMAHPWGYARNTYPKDKQALLDLSKEAVAALYKVDGHRFATGSSADIVYPASGASDDWTKGEGIQWVYLMELRPSGSPYFVLPESQILPAGKETFEAIKVVANKVKTG